MSNRLFSATGAVWHCGPKRVKRTWGGTLVGVLMLLGLAALAWWMISLLQHGSDISHSVTSGGMLLAMAPITEGRVIGLMLGLIFSGSVMLLVFAVRLGKSSGFVSPSNVPPSPPVLEVPTDPLSLPSIGMTNEDLMRIFAALIFECSVVQEMVRLAAEDGSVEDYGDRLKGVGHRMHGVTLCLGNLLESAGRRGGAESCVRGYSAPSMRHRPDHGGYAS